MKYIDEYRDPTVVQGLLVCIRNRAQKLKEPVTFMEVCGSHTYAIGRFGMRNILPENIRLLSGPGCPVCVTSVHDVDVALFLAGQENVIFTTFGDMLKVPGTDGNSLEKIRAKGADVRVVSSVMDCLSLVKDNHAKEIIFMGIGFETTSPTIAAMVKTSRQKGIENFSVFCVHKTIPPAMVALMANPNLKVDGFICPGHVSVIIGADAYSFIPERDRAAVVVGFEPIDILEGIYMLLGQCAANDKKVEIQYQRVVTRQGNKKALEILYDVFETAPAAWRGLGELPGSGLKFRQPYESFDTTKRFDIPDIESVEIEGCSCGEILQGIKTPHECPLFNKICSPLNPLGPCMVSSEGTCAAYYKYHLTT